MGVLPAAGRLRLTSMAQRVHRCTSPCVYSHCTPSLQPLDPLPPSNPFSHYTTTAPRQAPAIGRQWHTWSPDQDEHFRYEVAPARRCFDSPEEVEALTQEGLLRGGADFVALVAQGQDWYDDSLLRFPVDDSEAARHAIQSLLGVLALAALHLTN